MTPLAGLIIAIIAGWTVHETRRAAAVVVVPYLAVLAVQTWSLAVGDGVSPPSTVSHLPEAIGYWLVQLIFLVVALGIAAMLASLRARRGHDHSQRSRRQAAIASAFLLVAAALFVIGAVLTSAPVAHHTAGGNPPLVGYLGMILCAVVLAGLGLITITHRRNAARARVDAARPHEPARY
jgi:hypothetical protein